MNSVSVSAPGKIHLMGEHAVVYGKPALLSAINLRLTVTVESMDSSQKKPVEIVCPEGEAFIRESVAVIQNALHVTSNQPIRITVISNIPPGYHLGSSAAVAVALTGALMQFYTNTFNKQKINEIAYEIEKIAHGTPSGGDNTTVAYGGLLWYRKETEFLKLFSPVSLPSLKQFRSLQNFFLIDTGRSKESTKEMVSSVKQLFEKNPQVKKHVLDANEEAVKKAAEALVHTDESSLIQALQLGEQTLEAMQVVSAKIIPFIREIENRGGAAKILGGGGKSDRAGYLLCYHPHVKNVQKISEKYGYSVQAIQLGEEGVRLEKTR